MRHAEWARRRYVRAEAQKPPGGSRAALALPSSCVNAASRPRVRGAALNIGGSASPAIPVIKTAARTSAGAGSRSWRGTRASLRASLPRRYRATCGVRTWTPRIRAAAGAATRTKKPKIKTVQVRPRVLREPAGDRSALEAQARRVVMRGGRARHLPQQGPDRHHAARPDGRRGGRDRARVAGAGRRLGQRPLRLLAGLEGGARRAQGRAAKVNMLAVNREAPTSDPRYPSRAASCHRHASTGARRAARPATGPPGAPMDRPSRVTSPPRGFDTCPAGLPLSYPRATVKIPKPPRCAPVSRSVARGPRPALTRASRTASCAS